MALADYIYNKPVIETEQLVLRPMLASDVPSLKERWLIRGAIITFMEF